METDDLKMISYDFGHSYVLPHAAKCFHNTLDFHRKLFDYTPTEKVTVLIQDFGDYGNAGATAVPYNFISMGLSPFSYAFETSPAGERVFSMMNHELVHVTALDNSARSDVFFQNFFMGKVNPTSDHPLSMFYSYMTSPRMYAPRWYHEGIAAYVETWMNGGIGLAMGSFDEMVFRTRVLEDAHIYSAQGLESEGVTTDFQGRSNSYLYGTRFMGYLANKYGPDSIIEWVKRTKESKAFFAGQFKNVYGIPISQGWDEWIAFEREWQKDNLNTIRSNPITQGRAISLKSLGSISYTYHDKERNKLYLGVNHPGQYPHLAALDLETGELQNLTDIKGPALFYVTSLVFDEEADALYFTSDNNAWRDLMRYDLNSGQTEMLQEDFRTGDLALNKSDRSIWGIKHLNGFSTIIRVPKDNPDAEEKGIYNTWEQVYTLPYGEDIFDIDISPDGKILSAAVSDLKGNQSLLLYKTDDLLQAIIQPDTVLNFEVASPQGFRFTPDGRYLYGSSYYSGVSNIFRVDISTMRISAMSNALTGFFRPLPLNEEEILVYEFTSDGFVPTVIPNETASGVSSINFLGNITIEDHDVLKDWELPIGTTNEVDLNDYNYREGEYKPGQNLSVNYAYPTLVGYKDKFGLGYKFNISDPINLQEINVEFAYTPNSWNNGISSFGDSLTTTLDSDEKFHFAVSSRWTNVTFSAAYNEASFYDLFGPRVRSRKGIEAGLDWDYSVIWDLPRKLDLKLGLHSFYGLERSPEFQQISTAGFDETFFLRLNGSLDYKFLKRSLGAVEHEKGIAAQVGFSMAQSGGTLYPSITGKFDYGIQLPLNHSSFWIRGAAGTSLQDDLTPFTRFAFASFGNNYVDYQEYRQFRSPYSFPGISFTGEIPVIAKDYLKGTAEFVLPPLRYRKFGGFNFFANWTQASIFTSFLSTKSPDIESQQYANLGIQVDTRMVMFSHLASTLSFGYARAWQLDADRSFGEFMISLKLLH